MCGAADAILHGLGARVLSSGDLGLVLGVESDSPFAFRYSDMPNTGNREGKLLAGLVLVGTAAYAYPTPGDLLDDRVRRISEVEFETWLRATCEQLRAHDKSGEVIPDAGLDEAWRTYVNLPSTKRTDATGRFSSKCTMYWVRNGFQWLEGQGMARRDTTGTETAWMVTDRFRTQVADMASERAYTFLAGLARTTDQPEHPTDDLHEQDVP